jgi:hypothetical protein
MGTDTKRYRLPAELGGGEVEYLWPSKSGTDGKFWVVRVGPGGPQFEIHANWLTEIAPPIPPEPEPGAYLIGETVCFHDEAFGWWLGHRADKVWRGVWQEWEDAWAAVGGPDVDIVPLVPAPTFADLESAKQRYIEAMKSVTLARPPQGFGTMDKLLDELDMAAGALLSAVGEVRDDT